MDDDKLIECVRINDILYDQSHPKYLDCGIKDHIWKDIGEELKQPGNYF